MSKTLSANYQNGFCLAQYDEISKIQNSNIFEFADIDRDGFVDMLFLTDKKTMNFIVAYNMLKSSNGQSASNSVTDYNLNQRLVRNDIQNLKQSLQMTRKNICEDTNRPIEKLGNIYPSYGTVLYIMSEDKAKDNTIFDEESRFVYN